MIEKNTPTPAYSVKDLFVCLNYIIQYIFDTRLLMIFSQILTWKGPKD